MTIRIGAVTSAEPKMRGSLDRQATKGVKFSSQQQQQVASSMTAGSRSPAPRASSPSNSYSRGLDPLAEPKKTEEPSKLLQTEKAK